MSIPPQAMTNELRDVYVDHQARQLPPQTIRDLGHVNVVCGKNNSGKSTLLESLANWQLPPSQDPSGKHPPPHNRVSRSIRLTPELLERFREPIRDGFNQAGYAESVTDEQVRIIRRFLKEQEIHLYNVDAVLQTIPVREGVDRSRYPSGRIREILWKEVSAFPERVLVPAKRVRTVSAQASQEANQTLNPDGTNLLHFLSHRRSQGEGGALRTSFDSTRSAFRRVTDGFDFNVAWDGGKGLALQFRPPGGSWEGADAFGLGLFDVLLILTACYEGGGKLIIVEEPENHLHPAMQRGLLAALKENPDNQFILSTHSSVMLDNDYVDRVFVTSFEEGVRVRDFTSKASLLDDLGYAVTDNLVADLVVIVEGPTDVPVLSTFARMHEGLRDKQVRYWPIHGDAMVHMDLSVMVEGHRVLALVDRDPGSAPAREKFKARCHEFGIPCKQLDRTAIENYFTPDALRAVFGDDIPAGLTTLDPDAPVSEQAGIGAKKLKKHNRAIASAMVLDDIRGTDLFEFLNHMASTVP